MRQAKFRKAEIIFMEHFWQQDALHLQAALVKYILSHAKNCVTVTLKYGVVVKIII